MIIASYLVMMGISAALYALFIYEVMQRVHHGKPWLTPFTTGFALVVTLTVVLQWMVWYLMTNPGSLVLPALYTAVFALWTGSIVWWVYDILSRAEVRPVIASRKAVQDESYRALRDRVSALVEKNLSSLHAAGKEDIFHGDNDTQPAIEIREGSDE